MTVGLFLALGIVKISKSLARHVAGVNRPIFQDLSEVIVAVYAFAHYLSSVVRRRL